MGLVHVSGNAEVQHRLGRLAPFLYGLGLMALDLYQAGGILSAIPDESFPVADARFKRHHDSITYHPRGAVYFTITREGELKVAGQPAGTALTAALAPYVTLGRLRTSQGARTEEAPTEWFPPPRLLLDNETTELFIASVSPGTEPGARTVFVPLDQYIAERARLFVEAFKAVSQVPLSHQPEGGT